MSYREGLAVQTTALWQKENEHVGVIKNLAHIGLEKKKRTLLIQLKIPEQKKNERLAFFFFFWSNCTSWLFSLVYLGI